MEDERYRDFMHEFVLTDYQLQEVYTRFNEGLLQGLGKETNKNADMKCFITYVQELPTGDEVGQYLALDLGGSNFRVLRVQLSGHHEFKQDVETYGIPPEIMISSGRALFDHIANCLADFWKKWKLGDAPLPLGFTFSFPVRQIGLHKATLVRWTKGFNCSGVVDQDIGRLLSEAIARRGDIKISMIAILNDTTGTMLSCAYQIPTCRIGVIVGTGSNACYLERSENVELLSTEYRNKPHMVINIEWGAFGEHGALDFIRTLQDYAIDEKSINKGKQIFEKMLSGMYLGELVRLILLRATQENLIFTSCQVRSRLLHRLNCPNVIHTKFISDVERDLSADIQTVHQLLKDEFGLKEPTDEDCRKVKYTCECVSRRSGILIGVAVCALINKISEPKVVVALDGTVYRLHPKYDSYVREGVEKFLDSKTAYDLVLSEDGSGKGAALVAAVSSK